MSSQILFFNSYSRSYSKQHKEQGISEDTEQPEQDKMNISMYKTGRMYKLLQTARLNDIKIDKLAH